MASPSPTDTFYPPEPGIAVARVQLHIVHPKLGREWPLPTAGTALAAGIDLPAALDAPVSLAPRAHRLIPCGFRMALPRGFEAQVRPRSGLARDYGITCLNSPGTIDADYRGEVGVLLINFGASTFVIEPGMRIAQMVVAQVPRVEFALVDALGHTDRGHGGFGSTGQ